jgi:hypothetical protein
MPLRFLVPAFLLGLAALVIPLLVHLTRRQKARVVEFPSLMFLDRVPFQAESRRRIHHWLLLLLRALAVILIVAAFARPFFVDEAVATGSGGGPREVVVLLDRSYSMGIGDRWEGAREAARGVFRNLGPLDRASLAVFGKNAGVVMRSTTDRDRLLAALDTVTLSDEATAYGPGLKLSQTILEESDLPALELVVIGDFQRVGWTGDEGVRLPAGTVVTPVDLGEEPVPNRAVARVNLSRERLGGRDRVTAAARLTQVGGTAEDTVQVVLELEGRELQRKPAILPADGASGVVFDPFNVSQDFTRGTVRLAEGDQLVPDDVYHFVLSPGRTLSVLILDDGSREASSLFLRQALAISEENTFGVTHRAGGGVSPEDLSDAAVVVVNDRPFPGGNPAEALRAFVEGGGGLLVIMGDRFQWPSELADLLPGAFTGPLDRADGGGGRLGQLAFDHPVFEIFRGPRTGDFTSARFFRSRGLQVSEGEDVQVLARYDDGSAALAEKTVGDGRVLVWTSTMDTFWNDLVRQPVFLPFIHQLVRYTSGRTEAVAAFTAGQILDVTDATAMATAGLGEVAEDLAGDQARIAFTPSGETQELPPGEGPHFLHLDEQGIYEIRRPGSSDDQSVSVAVNVDLGEADLAPLDVEVMVASMTAREGEASGPRMEGVRDARLRLEDQERRQSLWRFLLLVALVLLGLETLISNRMSRVSGKGAPHAGR